MGIVYLAGRASKDERGGLMAVSPRPSARKVENAQMSTNRGHTIRIYRCCPKCGKGDTPLSRLKFCEVCGTKLPEISRGV